MYRIINDLDFFQNFLLEAVNGTTPSLVHRPTHDIIETKEDYIVEILLPGVKKEDISTELNKNELIIKAERKKNNDVEYIREQSFKGKYELKFNLSETIDKENINASFEEGILKLSIPKQQEKKKLSSKKIEIK